MVSIIENERSWGIQLISKINHYLTQKSYLIKKSGGESGLKCAGKTLFPDVYLFGGSELNNILQGWELKLPDTSITDSELIKNASIKATNLGLNSFLLWNFSYAVLYIKRGDIFLASKTWDTLRHIDTRKEALEIISNSPAMWEDMLIQIIDDLNLFFTSGELIGKSLVDVIDLDIIVESISDFSLNFQEYLRQESIRNTVLQAEIDLWWYENKLAYQEKVDDKKWEILTKIIINNWINKIIYAHILKKHYNEAFIIESLSDISNVNEAISIFERISKECDFWNIFRNYSIKTDYINADLYIPIEILGAFKEFNSFLNDFEIENLSPSLIEKLLINTIFQNKRKLAGQFSTPDKLARLLTRSVVDDKTKVVYDGCCGTGTIIKEAYKYKMEGLNDEQAINSLYASDKFSFPIQISNINLSNPENKGRLLQLFRSDIFEVNIGTTFKVYNPDNGNEIIKSIPEIDFIISNLPFIQQEDFQKFNPNVKNQINQKVETDLNNVYKINGKSDLYAYILIHLHSLLSEDGKIGIIISNSWLSSDWGEDFKRVLLSYFYIEKVITSGKGKWFNNADVVTNILILKKRTQLLETKIEEVIRFVTIASNINDLIEVEVNKLSQCILIDNADKEYLNINKYSLEEISNFESFNIGWNALFVNIRFLNTLIDKIVDISTYFEVQRGEKTGCDPLFYPDIDHGIEDEFIQKTLKTTKGQRYYDLCAEDDTFVCSLSMDRLISNNKTGAIHWIRRFEHKKSSVTKKSGREWYDFPSNIKVDFLINVNPDKSIVFYALDRLSYIGQRGIGLQSKNSINNKLLHALLNSILSIFFVEAVGFGRGLGALDLNSTKIQKMKMLNIDLLTPVQIDKIIELFDCIKEREIQGIGQEFYLADREEFDRFVLNCYGVEGIYVDIRKSLIDLYSIRSSVRD